MECGYDVQVDGRRRTDNGVVQKELDGCAMTDAPKIFSAPYYERMRRLEAGSWWNAGMRDIASALLSRVSLPENGLLLDVGCGSGQTMSWFEDQHRGWSAVGVDISTDGVGAARAAGLSVALADALRLPFDPGFADLLITLDVLQHLPFPSGDITALMEFARVLKPGAHLFVRTNCQSIPRATDDPVNMFRKYEPDDLKAKLVAAGFEIIALSRANAVLGFAEVAREMRASRESGTGYHGLLAVPNAPRGLAYSLKRAVLRAEGALISAGFTLPAGRSIVALCRKPRG
jgi:SAM-dependent methyltransferase